MKNEKWGVGDKRKDVGAMPCARPPSFLDSSALHATRCDWHEFRVRHLAKRIFSGTIGFVGVFWGGISIFRRARLGEGKRGRK